MSSGLSSALDNQQTIKLGEDNINPSPRKIVIPPPTLIDASGNAEVVLESPNHKDQEITQPKTIIDEQVALRPAAGDSEDLSCDPESPPPSYHQAAEPVLKAEPLIRVTISGTFGAMSSSFLRFINSSQLLTLVLSESAENYYIPPVSTSLVLEVDVAGQIHQVLNLGMQIADNGLLYIILVKVKKENTYGEERIAPITEGSWSQGSR